MVKGLFEGHYQLDPNGKRETQFQFQVERKKTFRIPSPQVHARYAIILGDEQLQWKDAIFAFLGPGIFLGKAVTRFIVTS